MFSYLRRKVASLFPFAYHSERKKSKSRNENKKSKKAMGRSAGTAASFSTLIYPRMVINVARAGGISGLFVDVNLIPEQVEYYQDEGQQFNEQQVQEQIQSLFDQPQQQDLSHEEEEELAAIGNDKEEEHHHLLMTSHANDEQELSEQFPKQSTLLSDEMADKQKVQNFLANKEKTDWRIVDELEANETNRAQNLMQQCKLEKTVKQQPQEALAETNITIAIQPNELEEQQKEEKSHKYLAVQQEAAEKGKGFGAARLNLYQQLVKQSDVLSATMRSYAQKKQAFQNVLANRQKIIVNLQSDIEIHMAKLDDAEDLIQQLKTEACKRKLAI